MVTVEQVKEDLKEKEPELVNEPTTNKTVEKKFYQKPIVWGLAVGLLIVIPLGIRAIKKRGSKIIDIS
jgi:hypothetical protein